MKLLALVLIFNLYSCSSVKEKKPASISEESIMATNWYQTSGEARALYYQGYNFATLSLKEALKKKSAKPKAVVVDIDETILDNSPYQAKVIQEDTSYPEYWADWINASKAEALPGSVEFLKFADSKKVKVFYISNRKSKDQKMTYELLARHGFPIKGDDQLLLQSDVSDKTPRRAQVSKNYEIVLLVGDNLNDFTNLFEGKTNEDKRKLVDEHKIDFGTKFIMLPNPMYGDWEGALYDYNHKRTQEEKHQLRMKALRSF